MKNTNKITLCSIMSALAVVIMLLSYFPYLTYAIPAVAGLCIMVTVIEINKKWAFFSYSSASVLVFLFAEPESKIMFIFFFGFYPIVKSFIEALSKPFAEWILKLLCFNVCIIAAYFVLSKVFMLSLAEMGELGKYGTAILLFLGNIVFVIYDIAVSKMAMLYIFRLHPKFKKLFKKGN